jgi:subtilisin family serine protease
MRNCHSEIESFYCCQSFFIFFFVNLVILFYPAFLLGLNSRQSYYLIYFQDKGNWREKISNPNAFLSQAALDRRANSQILIDSLDTPIAEDYLLAFQHSKNISIIGVSRWLNSILVQTELSQESLEKMYGVKKVAPYAVVQANNKNKNVKGTQRLSSISGLQYGLAQTQINMIPGLADLHQAGFTGKGITIGVFDSGFIGLPNNPAYKILNDEGRLLGWRDFVFRNSSVFNEDDHGTEVFSTIAAFLPPKMIGTGFGASFYLARTENAASETRLEEFYWLMAAEWADSLGMHIISSSLNYNTFDNPEENYTYANLDGKTSIISKAATIAATKGLLVVTSAGNYGARPWRYILPPCDADSIICVGGGRADGNRWASSSVGPTADGRIKPDVVALGQGCAIVTARGEVTTGSGTSYAAPLISGLAACLWQANPSAFAWQIRRSIIQSASLAQNPNNEIGHGWPNAKVADSCLKAWQPSSVAPEIVFFPNPSASGEAFIGLKGFEYKKYDLRLINSLGQEIWSVTNLTANVQLPIRMPFNKGVYFLEVTCGAKKLFQKIVID